MVGNGRRYRKAASARHATTGADLTSDREIAAASVSFVSGRMWPSASSQYANDCCDPGGGNNGQRAEPVGEEAVYQSSPVQIALPWLTIDRANPTRLLR